MTWFLSPPRDAPPRAGPRAREPLAFEMEGFEARAVQHEVDHLDGLLFVDRLVSRRTDLFRRKVYQKGGQGKP